MELSTLVSAASASERYDQISRGLTERQPPLHYTSPVKEAFGMATNRMNGHIQGFPPSRAAPTTRHSGSARPEPRNVCFQLISAESPQYRARLPMRVNIFPHDATESIITTVKNFYGLYPSATSSKGVSFEDEQGNTLIARYENFHSNMVVYVRVTEEQVSSNDSFGATSYHPSSGASGFPSGAENYSMQAPQQFGPHILRPDSRTSRKRSPSPTSGRGRRSASVSTNPKARSRSSKNRVNGANSQGDLDSINGYSSGDGATGSSSGRSKDALGNTDISLENIVEGGRRKRAKFESSELPLFAPPQMPAATSNPSVSPARRNDLHRASLPFIHQSHNPFTNPRIMQSPQNLLNGYSHAAAYASPVQDHRRARSSISGLPGVSGMGILPTPDPTVGSCMSEEDKDVAIQLMRLGDLSHVSHGRTSASTQDDTFSGRADATSSTGATSDGESESEDEEMPPARKQRLDTDGNSKKIFHTTESHFLPPGTENVFIRPDDDVAAAEGSMAAPKLKKVKPPTQNGTKARSQSTSTGSRPKVPKVAKPKQPGSKVKKAATAPSGPMSPNSLPASRKPSISSATGLPLIAGEDDQPDLSTKPRCQRCRKSKKGCDRQRPCSRCKDAGLPAEMCVSEDEGNGRKGRYGRHMGVPVSKDELPVPQALLPAGPIEASAVPIPLFVMGPSQTDKNKKRKR